MAQVLANLLGNGRQHGAPGERIAVRLQALGDRALLTVSNTAPAIDEALIAGLFDPLKRASLANARNPGGLGIGLYIAKEVVEGHGGSLSYSHDGIQVVFTIDLPRGRLAGAPLAAASTQPPPPPQDLPKEFPVAGASCRSLVA